MNTKQKIIVSSFVNAIPAYFLQNKNDSFGEKFGIVALFSTLPVIADKLLNQNITSNKAIQYGFTAAETVLGLGILCGFNKAKQDEKFSVNEFKGFFSHLFSTDLSKGDSGFIKVLTGLTIAFSFAHKYIWDSTDDINVELDQNSDMPIDIDGIKIEPATNTFDTI